MNVRRWRVTEISQILLILLDSRCPLLHYPPSLAAYLSRPVVNSVVSRGTLTADIGWLMEKILEIISLPDVLESPSGEKLVLVNFEKRRCACSIHLPTP